MTKNQFYFLLGMACLAGFAYLGFSLQGAELQPCILKRLTGYPCPTCGTTRSIGLLFRGDLWGALSMNPIGGVVGVMMVIVPVWLLYDLFSKKQTLFDSYLKIQSSATPKVIVGLLVLLLLNWICNIDKQL